MSLIDRFMTDEYVVKRTKRGSYAKGRYIPGPIEEIIVSGSLQPTNARELKLPEEGNRLKQYFKFYSDRQIVVDSSLTLATGDRVMINGESYRAMSSEIWHGVDLEYFMTILWREPEQVTDGQKAGT